MPTEPTAGDRLKELLIAKWGSLKCDHSYVLMLRKGRMFLQCDSCGLQTEGFSVASPGGVDGETK